MVEHIYLLCIAFCWDSLVGDPKFLWHPVCGVGWLIHRLEPILRRTFPRTKKGELMAGFVLLLSVTTISVGVVWLLFAILSHCLGEEITFILEGVFCGVLLAMGSLSAESMAVYPHLIKGNLPQARQALSMIVGRDTQDLDQSAITKATVETVAENFCDGVIAPICFLLVGGSLGMMAFKVVSTLDSMVGYQNDKYIFMGRTSAKMDDILNFIPARTSGLWMAITSFLLGMDGKNALKIYFRDRKNHKSPNSAHTEAAVAGGLGVQLGGDGIYQGKLVKKPTIGDATRELRPEDIRQTRALMLLSSLTFVLFVIFSSILWEVFLSSAINTGGTIMAWKLN